MFGSEQAWIQSKASLRTIYQVLGEYRFPLRLRGYYLSKMLAGLAPASVWDAGCGSGQTSFFLCRKFPLASLRGTDLLPQSIQRCDEIKQKCRLDRLEFEVGDILGTCFQSQFDLVVCFEVLEHIDDYRAALRKLSDALRPGGTLILHTPASGEFQSSSYGLRRFSSGTAAPINREKGQYHVREGYEKAQLTGALQEIGLQVEWCQYTFGTLAMCAHTLYELARGRTLLVLATFPLSFLLGLIDWRLPKSSGGGLLVRARKVVPR